MKWFQYANKQNNLIIPTNTIEFNINYRQIITKIDTNRGVALS